ncbi:MAG: hypothetical protein KBD44_00775 [Candidatus Pacebacteria bacterium]|nr:hypothetical protein [Candidatus Paceibacterota bacterium]
MNEFENRREVSPTLWAEYNRRTTSRWQRFCEGFVTFDQKVEDFCRWYWPHMIFAAGIGAMLWLGVKITLQPNGWYHVGRSLRESILGW